MMDRGEYMENGGQVDRSDKDTGKAVVLGEMVSDFDGRCEMIELLTSVKIRSTGHQAPSRCTGMLTWIHYQSIH